MSKLASCLFASALMLAPVCAYAESSLSDSLLNDDSFNIDVPTLNLDGDADAAVARPHGPGPGPRPGHRPPPPAPRPRPGVVIHHHHPAPVYYNVRPRVVQPVVVVEQPATTVVAESTESDEPRAYKLGFGLRGVGSVNSNVLLKADDYFESSELHNKINGGIGFYLKIRPIRWLSVELINDYMFGTFDDIQLKEFFKVPLVVGLRGHVFDYGGFDLYGAAAASVTFVSYESGDRRCDSDVFAQFGAQFGGGISFIASGLEIGLDMRYTIEEAPDRSPLTIDSNGYYMEMGEVDQNKPIHGFLFSVNLGFAL